ncbi:Uncharacterized protein DBV15_09934 [Temnothorax longispinosus]|uniref:Uncharacterized protein n=1 Tax=Temnothorax longispinosus TaxID=300112 RepID=A0A4S2KH49_9HYME|nr:Uncharacterized protein DBV15_09934 [Temnothorax longispinosus]
MRFLLLFARLNNCKHIFEYISIGNDIYWHEYLGQVKLVMEKPCSDDAVFFRKMAKLVSTLAKI